MKCDFVGFAFYDSRDVGGDGICNAVRCEVVDVSFLLILTFTLCVIVFKVLKEVIIT